MKDMDIYEGKKFTDLVRDIHDSTLIKRGMIAELIKELRGFLHAGDPNALAVYAPLIKDYLDLMVRNDDHLIKLAAIIQRIMMAEEEATGADGILSEIEKERILAEAKSDLEKEVKKLEKETEVDKTE